MSQGNAAEQNVAEQEAQRIFHDFFVQEYSGMLRYASALLKARDQNAPVNGRAEDAVQETFALAWDMKETVLSSDKPVGWLYKTPQYKVMDLVREENRWTKRLFRYEQLYVPPAEPHISLALELDGLVPKDDFDLLCKIYWEGYSYRELCPEMNLTKQALATKVHRIKKRIKEKLKE